MARRKGKPQNMAGQLLFADIGHRELVLDCVLVLEGESIAKPVTIKARLLGRSRESAIRALERWTEDGSVIEVVVAHGGHGPSVVISSESSRVELEPAA